MRVHRALAIAVATVITAGSTLAAAPAQAVEFGPFRGKIIAYPSLTIRQAPSVHSRNQGGVAGGAVIAITCKARGSSVRGNSLWYRTANTEWLSARYIQNLGAAPQWCAAEYHADGVVSANRLSVRAGPTTLDRRVGTVRRHNDVEISCKVIRRRVGGNSLWYQITNGQWVSARYVDNLGPAPGWCIPGS